MSGSTSTPDVLSASTTAGAVAALPLTAGNAVFQTLLVATAVVAAAVLIVRIVRRVAEHRSI